MDYLATISSNLRPQRFVYHVLFCFVTLQESSPLFPMGSSTSDAVNSIEMDNMSDDNESSDLSSNEQPKLTFHQVISAPIFFHSKSKGAQADADSKQCLWFSKKSSKVKEKSLKVSVFFKHKTEILLLIYALYQCIIS